MKKHEKRICGRCKKAIKQRDRWHFVWSGWWFWRKVQPQHHNCEAPMAGPTNIYTGAKAVVHRLENDGAMNVGPLVTDPSENFPIQEFTGEKSVWSEERMFTDQECLPQYFEEVP